MKKIFLSVFLVMVVTVLTGCGGKKVTCSGDIDMFGYKATTTMEGKLSGDNVVEAKVSMTITFDDEETAKAYYEFVKDGDDTTATRKGKSVTVSATEKAEKGDEISKADFIEEAEAMGLKCK